MLSSFRNLLCAALLASVSGTQAAPLASTASEITTFFENSTFGDAVLSPDAKCIAMRIGGEGIRDRLAVIELSTRSAKILANFSDADIGQFHWVNNERLVFDLTDKHVGQGDVRYGSGLYAVNRDGTRFIQLADRSADFLRESPGFSAHQLLPWNTFLMSHVGGQDSEFIYVTSPKLSGMGEVAHVDLLRLNTLTGRAQTLSRPGKTQTWILDNQGEPRIVTTLEQNMESVYYRDPAGDAWRKLVEFDAYIGSKGVFSPLAISPDGTFYVTTRMGTDKATVHTFDFATNKVKREAVIELAGYDFSGHLLTNAKKMLGIRYETDAAASTWFDPDMKAIQEKVDALLPSTVNLISTAARPEAPFMLVESYSDVQPPVYLLFNTDSKTLEKLGDTHRDIDPARMSHKELVHYKARDGLDIPAWLTVPHGSTRKDLPLVVLVHGGPYVRGGHWRWDPEAQFLASRGYAVLEPEYRGSTGFGYKHYRAGWKQWGLAMQNDIADGAKWAIAQGIVDPKRICIAGASYGGYATLMGLINDPDLYQCGIDWVGVSDIKLIYTGNWSALSDISEGWKRYGMPDLIGDLVKDADQLKATSPLEQAARIKQPLLLAYGGADMRVPIYHGKKFRDAVSTTNHDVEWVEYPEEGHGWALPKNRIDFWTRVEKFLARTIGKP
ncbi:dipeptidyl aminopeptidase/acylaminoacyl peptidase [Oxalobacteraceae bacterium GrIS 1.11]